MLHSPHTKHRDEKQNENGWFSFLINSFHVVLFIFGCRCCAHHNWILTVMSIWCVPVSTRLSTFYSFPLCHAASATGAVFAADKWCEYAAVRHQPTSAPICPHSYADMIHVGCGRLRKSAIISFINIILHLHIFLFKYNNKEKKTIFFTICTANNCIRMCIILQLPW